jgi:hypothetical protein
MGDIALPKSLKPIVSKGYGQTRGSNIVRNQPQGGVFRQAKRYGTEPVPFSVVLTVDEFGRQVFYDFYDASIDNGRNSFPMPLDSGNGAEEVHQCWISSDVSDQTQNGVYWDITFTIVAETTPTQNKPFGGDLSDIANEYDTVRDLISVLNGLDDLVENYVPLGN